MSEMHKTTLLIAVVETERDFFWSSVARGVFLAQYKEENKF